MAKFTFTGLDNIQMQLEARGAKVSGTVNHMLHAGAKIAREEMQAALEANGTWKRWKRKNEYF